MSCRFLLVVLASCLAAQSEPISLTITASRAVYPQPDEAVFWVQIFASADVGLPEILAALRDAGVTEANLANVSDTGIVLVTNPPQNNSRSIRWTFVLNTPLSRMSETVSALRAVQQAIATNKPGVLMSFAPLGL